MNNKRYLLRGFTLLEVVISVFIISIALLGLVSVLIHSTRGGNFNKDEFKAREYAQSIMSELLPELAINPTLHSDSNLPLLDESITGAEKFTYSVINIKAVEATASDDTLRDITVEIKWADSNGGHSYKLKTYITGDQEN